VPLLLEQKTESAFSTPFTLAAPPVAMSISVSPQPDHGTVETTPATNFATYPKDNLRYKCNQHRVKGVQVNYKSAEKYVGDDALDILVLFPGGFAWEVHYDISVR
jgi:hypothetical protein